MRTQTAVDTVNHGITFMPGWSIVAEDFTTRHEGTICLYITYPGRETKREEAPGYPTHNEPRAAMLLQVGNYRDATELHRGVIGKLIEFWTHEAREFYRVTPTMWAPFHPHKIDGMQRWGEVDKDLYFGFNAMDWLKGQPLPVATKPVHDLHGHKPVIDIDENTGLRIKGLTEVSEP